VSERFTFEFLSLRLNENGHKLFERTFFVVRRPLFTLSAFA
jgi:hypothetical protein